MLATSSQADDRTRVLKHGETFCLFDRYGDIQHMGIGEQGLYHEGTRFLSGYKLTINERRPLLLNSNIKRDNTLMTVDMTTTDIYSGGEIIIPKGVLHVFRSKILWDGVHYEHIHISNYGEADANIVVDIDIDADYEDIFEVRGEKRHRRGVYQRRIYKDKEILLGYKGLDDITRRTHVRFSEKPTSNIAKQYRFAFHLPAKGEKELYISTACEVDGNMPLIMDHKDIFEHNKEQVDRAKERVGSLFTSNEQFNDWVNRAEADLRMLTTKADHGLYPYAGVPWFSTPFGRDGIITALQYLSMYPELARGVLRFLAETQATEYSDVQDAEPGKILHETRKGEMANLGEIPFKRYYGSVDSTPLFIVLAGAYYDRTGDRPFIESIWPNIEAALNWIDQYGDCDGDGFVEYAKHSEKGLVQQGWKDSNDSVFHQDGSPAKGPIALCEVQGYVYDAKITVARLARLFGEEQRADELEQQAEELKVKFNSAFWCDDISTFAIALDGDKKPCKVRSSNAGHTLFSGIASKEYARRVKDTLLSDDSFSGWGIRTLAKGEARFNPMSYHNGSIWPHDNAVIAMGFSRYGFRDEAMKVLTALFDASIWMDLHRLPELFCGFDRLPGQSPTLYPVACSPQAWASGAVFQMIQACLGIEFSPDKPQLIFDHPQLPDYLHRLQITNFRFGNNVIDLALRRHTNDVGVNVLRKEGNVELSVIV